MAQEDYRKALRIGQKEFRSSVLKGTYPYLQALDEILEHTAVEYTEPLGVVTVSYTHLQPHAVRKQI